MNFGVELVSELSLTIRPDHYFRLELYFDDELLTEGTGKDYFDLNCCILPHKIVSASGREGTYKTLPVMEAFEALPAKPIRLADEILPSLKLKITSNRVLDYAELKHNFSLHGFYEDQTFDVHLARPDVPVTWEKRGQFSVPLGSLLSRESQSCKAV